MSAPVAAAHGGARWEVVVGLEVHCQLKTATKIFCACPTSFGAAPNAHTCPVCLGLPGALPVLNAEAVRLAVRAALALGCTVHPVSVFARKHYFYPDLPKGYQISQFDRPLATAGAVALGGAGVAPGRTIRVHRVHMEEDAGKSVHDRFPAATGIDLNRAGTPLVEIVSEPDIRSAAEAGCYLRRLKQLLEHAGVSDANMEEGSLRVDVNLSLRPIGADALGTKTEVKNLNSFSAVERAIELEAARQAAILDGGGAVVQATLLYDDRRQTVRPARAKEGSHDYRYFPEPDLPPLRVEAALLAAQQAALPELPPARRERLARDYGLGEAEVEQLIATVAWCEAFERLAAACGDPRRACTWLLGPVTAALNQGGWTLDTHPVAIDRLAALIRLEVAGDLSNTAARQLFTLMEREPGAPAELARREGLLLVRDDDALAGWIDAVFVEHPAEAARFLAGERKLLGVLVGLVMRKSGGAADPRRVNQQLAARAG